MTAPEEWRPGVTFRLRSIATAAAKMIGAAAVGCWAVAVILRLGGNTHRGLQIELLYTGAYAIGACMIVMYIGMKLRAGAVDRRSFEDFTPLAPQLGLSYADRQDHLVRRWESEPFTNLNALHEEAHEVLTGTFHARAVLMFRYRFWTEYDRSDPPEDHRFAAVELPHYLPGLRFSTDDYEFAHTAPGLKRLDVDIENAEFNRRYRIDGVTDARTRRLAVAILNPRAVEWLLSTSPFPWGIDGRYLTGYWNPLDPAALCAQRLEILIGIADDIPDHIWDLSAGS